MKFAKYEDHRTYSTKSSPSYIADKRKREQIEHNKTVRSKDVRSAAHTHTHTQSHIVHFVYRTQQISTQPYI